MYRPFFERNAFWGEKMKGAEKNERRKRENEVIRV
jgi:hypothetical protein